MNTYYLKKFRKAAKKHVKVEILHYEHDDFIGITTNDYTRKITMAIQNRIPNNIIKWIFPKGLNYSVKLYYGKSDLCFCLSTNPSCAISLNELSRKMQVKALYNARHLYIKLLIRVERQKQQIYKEYIKMIKTKRKMLKDKYELNNLKDDLLHRSS